MTTAVASTVVAATSRTPAAAAAGPSTADLPAHVSVFTWGADPYGQLGRPAAGAYSDPARISLPDGVVARTGIASDRSSYVIDTAGGLWSWGFNRDAELGDGTTTDRSVPAQVALPAPVTDLSVGGSLDGYPDNVLASTSDGRLFTWGFRHFPIGSSDAQVDPLPVPLSILPPGVGALSVATGFLANENVQLAVGTDHVVYRWLYDDTGAHALRTVPLPGDVGAAEVRMIPGYTVVVRGTDGQVYSWDLASQHPTVVGGGRAVPGVVPIAGRPTVTGIAVGRYGDDAYAITSDGRAFAWGRNNAGQLGTGGPAIQPTPVQLTFPGNPKILSVAGSDTSAIAVAADGEAFSWGDSTALDSTFSPSPTPRRIVLPPGSHVTAAMVGHEFAGAIADDVPYAPIFAAGRPAEAAYPGQPFSYRFVVDARPAATFALTGGAPSWLTIDPATGVLSGTAPGDSVDAVYSVTATNSQGTTTAGPFRAISGPQVEIRGRVVPSNGGEPVSGARVDACLATVCTSTTSAGDGTFVLPWFAGNDAAVSAFPPAATNLGTTRLEPQAVDGTGLDLGDVVAPVRLTAALVGQPAFVLPDGTPGVNWGWPIPLALHGCAHGMGVSTLVASDEYTGEPSWRATFLPESGAAGSYAGAVEPAWPLHGGAHLSVSVVCPPTVAEVTSQPQPGPAAAGDRAGTPGTTARRALALSLSPQQIRELIQLISSSYQLYSKVKASLNFDAAVAGVILARGCFENLAALKPLIELALKPAVKLLESALEPWIVDLALSLAIINPILGLVALPIISIIVDKVVSKVVDMLIDAALEAAMAKLCTHPIDPNLLIDPSGSVIDQNGHPIAGATVHLLRADTFDGPFDDMSTADPGVLPAVNPETTDGGGSFQWDVRAGYYEIRASAPNCTSSTVPGASAETLGPLPVPPPQVGLIITLHCALAGPADRPVVTGLTATVGRTSGGTRLEVLGSGFTPASSVTFGTQPAATTFVSPSVLSVATPAGAGGVHVTVATDGGRSATSRHDVFTFADRPTVARVSPAGGADVGGTRVVITGTGFDAATAVTFGSVPARTFTRVDAHTLRAVVPAGVAGPAMVQVVGPAGTSTPTRAAIFRYVRSADLVVRLAGAVPATRGATARLGCLVTDLGPDRASHVVTVISLPRGLVGARSAHRIRFTTTSLAAGHRTTYRIAVRRVGTTGRHASVLASSSSRILDPRPGNNTARLPVRTQRSRSQDAPTLSSNYRAERGLPAGKRAARSRRGWRL